jgi:hypothetical protein
MSAKESNVEFSDEKIARRRYEAIRRALPRPPLPANCAV